jgi:hypothetical protein
VLRQLARLTRPLPAAGSRALAIAVYADSAGQTFAARETGSEGIACVDDAARAVVLLTDLWLATGNDRLKAWAEGLLDFLLFMHDGAGGWFNFIHSWDGDRNTDGLTSTSGSNFWQARATGALASAGTRLGRVETRPALFAALRFAAETAPPADVRALHVLAAVNVLRGEPNAWLAKQLGVWCEELRQCRAGDTLMNSPDERGRPHLWGHVQEGALADAAGLLDRPDLLDTARRSAAAVFEPAIESGFDLPHVHPYDVQSSIFVMDRLAAATADIRYAALARKAREWFGGRNPAASAVYDREGGRVADGVDQGVINAHSGAEANISGGLALLADPFVMEQAAASPGEPILGRPLSV